MDVTTKAMRTLLLAGLATLLASPSGAQVPLTLDTSFRCTPVTYPPGLSDALPLADGSVVITGWFGLTTNYFSSWMVKLLPVGDLDVFWGINGGGGYPSCWSVLLYFRKQLSIKVFPSDRGIGLWVPTHHCEPTLPGS